MSEFALPTSADLKEVEQALLPVLTQDDPIFESFPVVEENAALLLWDQRERFTGIQGARGEGGDYKLVDQVPIKRFWTPFGVYGDFQSLDEEQLVNSREIGTFGAPASIDDLVGPCQQHLLQRRINRQRYNLWQTITTGTITVTDKFGVAIYTETYALQTFTATVVWATLASATPEADIRVVQRLGRGWNIDFGAKAKLVMNRETFQAFIMNNNAADLGGTRLKFGQTVNSVGDVNQLFTALDLPQVQVYDDGWLSDPTNPSAAISSRDRQYNLFVPNNVAVLIGQRRGGAPIGNYVMGKNIDNVGMKPGAFMTVVDSAEHGIHPRRVGIYDGHRGAIRVPYPEGVVIMTV